MSKLATFGWGLFACVVAMRAANQGSLIEVVNRYGSFVYGSLLGVFILAILTKRATARGAFWGTIAGIATVPQNAPRAVARFVRIARMNTPSSDPYTNDPYRLTTSMSDPWFAAREVKLGDAAFISCWVAGLPENCDRANVTVYLGETRLRVQYVGTPDAHGLRQINAALPADTARGEHPCRVECAGVRTEPSILTVI